MSVSSFNEALATDGWGKNVLLEVSYDNFASIVYRWSTVSMTVAGNNYEARIIGLGQLKRALGRDNIPEATHTQIDLDNTDFLCDFLCDRIYLGGSGGQNTRYRLSLALYDPATPTNVFTKVIGTFKTFNQPNRNNSRVSLQLADDTFKFFNEIKQTPTVRDWMLANIAYAECPLNGSAPVPGFDWDRPLPLAWGTSPAFSAVVGYGNDLNAHTDVRGFTGYVVPIVVCATRNMADATANDAQRLWVRLSDDAMLGQDKCPWAGQTIEIPKTVTVPKAADLQTSAAPTPGTYEIWRPRKSVAITKSGGFQWRIVWVDMNMALFQTWFIIAFNTILRNSGNTPVTQFGLVPKALSTQPGEMADFKALAQFIVKGNPLSAITGNAGAEDWNGGLEVIQDLIGYYSAGTTASLDSTLFTRAEHSNAVPVQGQVQSTIPANDLAKLSSKKHISDAMRMGDLRQALSDIARSINVDLFTTWDGKIGVLAGWLDFDRITATRVNIDETRAKDVQDRTPSDGDRWAPYNRVYVTVGDGSTRGPFDNSALQDVWGAIISRVFEGKWLKPIPDGEVETEKSIWQLMPLIESVVRPVISFITDREALQLELGDIITFTWTRGGASPVYSATEFRVESMSLNLDSWEVALESVWVHDGDYPFLLDDETLLVRVASSAGRTATVVDGSAIVTFSSGDLDVDNVQSGDILVLQDATEAQSTFGRNRGLRIVAIVNATHAQVQDDDGVYSFGAGAGIAVATWTIYRGETTYPTAASDPTNYPGGGRMYGKVCDDDDVYTDGFSNKLL